MADDGPTPKDLDPLEEALGERRASEVREELATAGYVAIDVVHLAQLEQAADGYRRLFDLAHEPAGGDEPDLR